MATSDPLVRTLLLVIVAILLIPFLMMILALPMMGLWGGGHMWDWNGTAGGGWVVLMMVILPLAVLLAVGYLLYRGLSTRDRDTDGALEELRLAYARGDLTDEEFEERRNRLRREE